MSDMRIDEIGPGIWWITHSLAVSAQTDDGVQKFKEHVEYLKEKFPCEKCRPHIKNFFEKHKVDDYRGDMINDHEVGLFRLTWIMHSQVNERLNKPFFSFEKAYDVYFTQGSCKMDICDGTVDRTVDTSQDKKVARVDSGKKTQKKKFTLMRLNA